MGVALFPMSPILVLIQGLSQIGSSLEGLLLTQNTPEV